MSTRYYYIKPYKKEDDSRLRAAIKEDNREMPMHLKRVQRVCMEKGLGNTPLKVLRTVFQVNARTYRALLCTTIPFVSFKACLGGVLRQFGVGDFTDVLMHPYFDCAEHRKLLSYHFMVQSSIALLMRDSLDYISTYKPK